MTLLAEIPLAAQKLTRLVDKSSGVYVGTPCDAISIMLEMARIGESDMVCDLGFDDDHLLIIAAQNYVFRRFRIPDRSCMYRGFKKNFSSTLPAAQGKFRLVYLSR